MKYLLIILVCFSCCGTKGTKQTDTTTSDTSTGTVTEAAPINSNKPDTTELVKPVFAGKQIAIRFGSLASGPIGDEFLKTWMEKFIKNEKANITADKYSGCGKEGEYIIVVTKNNFNKSMEDKFTTGLEKLIEEEVKRTKAISSSSGSVNITNDPTPEDYSYCRLGSKKWL